MLGIIITLVGFIGFIYGITIIFGFKTTKDNDTASKIYAGSKGVFGGLLLIFLGLVIYFTK
jgi:hypothetical protein